MKGSLEDKRKELAAMEEALQQEHVDAALAHAKSAFAGKPDCLFSSPNAITHVSIVSSDSYDWVMDNRLQGGGHDKAKLFEITAKYADWKLYLNFSQGGRSRPEEQQLWFQNRATASDAGKPQACITSIDALHLGTMPEQLVSAQGPEETRESYAIRVGEFWAHLETFLLIYMQAMAACPMAREQPMGTAAFMRHFCYAKWRH